MWSGRKQLDVLSRDSTGRIQGKVHESSVLQVVLISLRVRIDTGSVTIQDVAKRWGSNFWHETHTRSHKMSILTRVQSHLSCKLQLQGTASVV
jgi:hypothetical protein